MIKNYVFVVLAGALLSTNAIAAEPKSNPVYLVPGWISNKNPAPDFSCSQGQSRYRQHLLYMALEGGRLEKSKSNYYNLATFLGYFADNPVAKDEIVTKVQATIDKDVAAMDALVAKRPYFLFVGDYGSSQGEGHIRFSISMPEGPNDWNGDKVRSDKYAYNWEKNSFHVSAYGPHAAGSLSTDIVTSSKEWKDKWQGIFQYAGDSLASRLLLDNKMNPVLAEIFDKDSGKTVLSWAAPGVNQQKLQAMIPETPASEYDFENCDSLNPDYYKNPNVADKMGGALDGLNQKIDSFNKRANGSLNFKFW
jgi:hypothetical protein